MCKIIYRKRDEDEEEEAEKATDFRVLAVHVYPHYDYGFFCYTSDISTFFVGAGSVSTLK